jgi:hypothetical protein
MKVILNWRTRVIYLVFECTWWRLFLTDELGLYILSLSVPDEGYSRSTSCALNLISTFLLDNNKADLISTHNAILIFDLMLVTSWYISPWITSELFKIIAGISIISNVRRENRINGGLISLHYFQNKQTKQCMNIAILSWCIIWLTIIVYGYIYIVFTSIGHISNYDSCIIRIICERPCDQLQQSSTMIPYDNTWCHLQLNYTDVNNDSKGTHLISFTYKVRVRVMVFNATFNNVPVISLRFVLLVEVTGEIQPIHRKSLTNFIT